MGFNSMALNDLKCNHLASLGLKALILYLYAGVERYVTYWLQYIREMVGGKPCECGFKAFVCFQGYDRVQVAHNAQILVLNPKVVLRLYPRPTFSVAITAVFGASDLQCETSGLILEVVLVQ